MGARTRFFKLGGLRRRIKFVLPTVLVAFGLGLPEAEAGGRRVAFVIGNSGKLYLAGDGVSYSGGWTEGALQTAINCATAVAYRLKGKLPSYNALVGQNPQLYDYGS